MRVSQMSFYRLASYQTNRYQQTLAELNQMATSGTAISQVSDDTIGAITVFNTSIQLADIDQYLANIENADNWLGQADSDFGSMSDLVVEARALAEQMATGTMDSSNRENAAETIMGYLEELVNFSNTEISGAHIYSGTATDDSAVDLELKVDDTATGDEDNSGTGTIYATGSYSGFMSRTISLTATATSGEFQVGFVDDYGRQRSYTVNTGGTGGNNTVSLGDGIEIYIDEGTFEAGDTYTLNVGRYSGNSGEIYANLSWETRMTYNYTPDEFYGAEGNTGDGWSSVLDTLAQWSYYMERDSTERDYFESVGAADNALSSTGDFLVSGDWDTLNQAQLSFNVGGVITSDADSADLAHFSDFTIDPGYEGGVPSADNPMTVTYTYDGALGGAPAGTYTLVITDVGDGNSYSLCDGGVEVGFTDAAYEADDPVYQVSNSYDSGSVPSETNPMEVTYTWVDNDGVRQKNTVTFTGTGEDYAQTLNPPGGISVTLADDGTFSYGDTWDTTLEQYNQGQAYSQNAIEELEASMNTLLQYRADAGAKINRLEVRTNFFESDQLRIEADEATAEGVDIATAAAEWSTQLTMYKAALQATSMISTTSLADYI